MAVLILFFVLLMAVGWRLHQSDHWILWRMGLNPAKLTVHRVQGKDGYVMVYSNTTTLIYITHSRVSGVSVTRENSQPRAQQSITGIGVQVMARENHALKIMGVLPGTRRQRLD
jgi:hypothetical protein